MRQEVFAGLQLEDAPADPHGRETLLLQPEGLPQAIQPEIKPARAHAYPSLPRSQRGVYYYIVRRRRFQLRYHHTWKVFIQKGLR